MCDGRLQPWVRVDVRPHTLDHWTTHVLPWWNVCMQVPCSAVIVGLSAWRSLLTWPAERSGGSAAPPTRRALGCLTAVLRPMAYDAIVSSLNRFGYPGSLPGAPDPMLAPCAARSLPDCGARSACTAAFSGGAVGCAPVGECARRRGHRASDLRRVFWATIAVLAVSHEAGASRFSRTRACDGLRASGPSDWAHATCGTHGISTASGHLAGRRHLHRVLAASCVAPKGCTSPTDTGSFP